MKKGIAIAALLFRSFLVFSQDVSGGNVQTEGESIDYTEMADNLSSVNAVSFVSYEGPYARIDSRDQIRNIGYELGTAVRQGASFAGDRDRYFVLHSVTGPEFDRLNADVFGLGPDAGVDHIRNLRLIIQGYLEAAYGYSVADAALLAEFSTVYNAVFRGNWPYFSTRYKTALVQYIEPRPDSAGLSIRFDEWPGQTLIMLPLQTAAPDSLSAIDTGTISSEEVIDEMRKDDDRGVDARQDLVDLKEREAEEASRAAAEQRRQVEESERQLAENNRRLAEERERAAEEQRRIDQERAALAASGAAPEEKTAAEDRLKEQEETLAETNRQLDERGQAQEDQRDALDAQREQAAQNEAFADQREDEARNERAAIAEDQAAIIANGGGIDDFEALGVLAIHLAGTDSPLGVPVRIEPVTGAEIQRGRLDTVRVRTLTAIAGRVFVIAGENTANGAIRLIEIDQKTLGMKAQGTTDIIGDSPLWANGTSLYALVSVNGAIQLARFNLDLEQQAVTRTGAHPQSTVIFADTRLLIQGPGGGILSLDADTLAR
jgi:hypothetical protein